MLEETVYENKELKFEWKLTFEKYAEMLQCYYILTESVEK